jgi:ATP adenylyltransferase
MTKREENGILWAPWRMEYILSDKEGECLFCAKPQLDDDKNALILHRSSHSFVMMNRYPYNNGHLLVAPFRHLSQIEDLSPDEVGDLFRLVQLSVRVIKEKLQPHGLNLGMNIGAVAGAGVKDHVHLHVVPRWTGDTSFMPVVASTSVMPQALEETYAQLREGFDERSR